MIHLDKSMKAGAQGARGFRVGSWLYTAMVNFGLENDILHSLSVGFIIHTDLLKTFVFSLLPSFYMDIHNLFS